MHQIQVVPTDSLRKQQLHCQKVILPLIICRWLYVVHKVQVEIHSSLQDKPDDQCYKYDGSLLLKLASVSKLKTAFLKVLYAAYKIL